MNLGQWLFLHYTEDFCKWCKNCLSLVICGVYLLTYLLACLLAYSVTHSLTHSLTPWSRVLLEKLTGFQLVKFPAFYGSQRFITAFISARHLSLSWANLIQSIPPRLTSWRSILLLSSHLCPGLLNGLFPSGFPTKILCTSPLSPIHTTCLTHLILLDFITRVTLGEEYRSLSSSLCSFLHSPVTSSLLGPNILLFVVHNYCKNLFLNCST